MYIYIYREREMNWGLLRADTIHTNNDNSNRNNNNNNNNNNMYAVATCRQTQI